MKNWKRKLKKEKLVNHDNVLIIGPSWVGDMIMSQLIYEELKKQNPNTKITVV